MNLEHLLGNTNGLNSQFGVKYDFWLQGQKKIISFDKFLIILKWKVEMIFRTAMFGLFWLIFLSSFLSQDYFIDPHQGGLIRRIIGLCVKPSIEDLCKRIITVIILNLMFNLILRYGRLRITSYHILSLITGYFVLHTNSYPRNLLLILGFLVVILLLVNRIKHLLKLDCKRIQPVYIVSSISMLLLILGELFFPNRRNWQESRGVLMIMAMKIISLSFDKLRIHTVTYTELLGYLFCPATILFGPWISINEYRMNCISPSKINWKWAVRILEVFSTAMIFMVMSNCLSSSLVPAGENYPFGCKWLEAFRSAFIFRASNYFICYMAEFTMLIAGFNKLHGRPGDRWQYTICRPFSVEFPRSMAVVVRNWNIPVHRFLKDYVYLPYAEVNRGFAVIFTFLVSAMLHGMNTRITIILISLGLLSFAQQVIQQWLSDRLSSCCKINPCRVVCLHIRGRFHPITLIINGVCLILNMIHLAYLGYIMDENFETSSFTDLYFTWEEDFGLFTHHMMLFGIGIMLFLL